MIRRLFELATGRPWTTTRSAAVEFGPPPGAVYAEAIASYTDAELVEYGNEVLDQIRGQQAVVARLIEETETETREVTR